MITKRNFLVAVICLFPGFIATFSVAQPVRDDHSVENLGAGAKLVITAVSGPAVAVHEETISLTYSVENKGTAASGSYKVGFFLSTDKEINPAEDRLLDRVTFSTGLAPGQSRKKTASVLVPGNGLSGMYYYGAVVASSRKASAKQVSLPRYSLANDNDTVTDHKTGLIWQRRDDGVPRAWEASGQHCAELLLGDSAGWRLPSVDELATIVDYSRFDPAIDSKFECRSDYYWSHSTVANGPDAAWDVSFYNGFIEAYGKGNDHYVRCVRSGP